MALTIGELTGIIDLDDRGFGRGLAGAEGDFDRFGRQLDRGLAGSEDDFRQWSGQIQHLTSEAFNEVADDARTAGEEAGRDLQRGLERGLDGTKDTARRSGDDSGRGFGDGTESGARGRLGGVGGKLAGLLSKAGPWMAAGAAIGGTLMVGLQGAMENQDATAKLKAQLGAFGPEGERLGRIGGELFAGAWGDSVGQVNEALRSVIQNVSGMADASDADLKKVTASVMDLGTAFDLDVGETSRAVGKLIKTGLAKDATQALDLLTRGFQSGANEADDLLDSVSEYSTIFRAAGLSGAQMMGLISQGLKAGARDADVVADAIKEFTIEAVAGGARVMGGFKSLGLNARQMSEQFGKGGATAGRALDIVLDRLRSMPPGVKRNAVAIELFGTKAEDLGDALYALDPSEAAKKLGVVGGAAQKMGDTLNNTASAKITSFTRTLKKELVDFVGGNVLPGLEKLGGKASAAITGWLADNPGVVAKFEALWEKVGAVVGKIVGDVKTWLDENKDDIQKWSDKYADAAENAAEMLSAALDLIVAIWERFGPRTMEILAIFGSTYMGFFSGLFKTLTGLFDIFAGLLTGDWSRLWSGIQGLLTGVGQALWAIISGVLRLIKMQWDQAWEKVKQTASTVWAWITSFVGTSVGRLLSAIGLLASLPGKVGAWFGAMKDRAVARASSLVTWMRGLPGRIRSAVGPLGGLLAGAGRNIVTGLWNGISGMTSWLYGKIMGWIRSTIPGPVLRFLGIASPSKLFAKYGRYIAQGLAQGILGGTGLVSSAAGTLAAATMAGGVPITPGGSAAAGTGGSSAGVLGTILIDLIGGEGQFLRWMRSIVLAEGGGDVQLAFGKRR